MNNKNLEKGNLKKKLMPPSQMSEAFTTSAILAVSGGFQDAYTYFTRDEVFSNAQTGNVVLMSQHMLNGEWQAGLRYLFPLLAFVMGVFVADVIKRKYQYAGRLHWRQYILLMEIAILLTVGFIPAQFNTLAAILVSFSCAMQVQTFRKVNGYAYASTMCIGNLRSGTESLSAYVEDRNPANLRKALHYFGIIGMFAIGAGIGGNASISLGICAVWFSCGLLLISFLLMFIGRSE